MDVLLRFREEPVGLMADVEAVRHQLKVHPHDFDALRFLWYPDCDFTREPEEYHMAVHLFVGCGLLVSLTMDCRDCERQQR